MVLTETETIQILQRLLSLILMHQLITIGQTKQIKKKQKKKQLNCTGPLTRALQLLFENLTYY